MSSTGAVSRGTCVFDAPSRCTKICTKKDFCESPPRRVPAQYSPHTDMCHACVMSVATSSRGPYELGILQVLPFSALNTPDSLPRKGVHQYGVLPGERRALRTYGPVPGTSRWAISNTPPQPGPSCLCRPKADDRRKINVSAQPTTTRARPVWSKQIARSRRCSQQSKEL